VLDRGYTYFLETPFWRSSRSGSSRKFGCRVLHSTGPVPSDPGLLDRGRAELLLYGFLRSSAIRCSREFQTGHSPYALPRNCRILALISAGFSSIMKWPTPSINSDSEPSPQ
jgi:hypothetical protein